MASLPMISGSDDITEPLEYQTILSKTSLGTGYDVSYTFASDVKIGEIEIASYRSAGSGSVDSNLTITFTGFDTYKFVSSSQTYGSSYRVYRYTFTNMKVGDKVSYKASDRTNQHTKYITIWGVQ